MKQVRRQSFTILNRRFAGNVPTWSPFVEEAYPPNYMVGQPKNHISEMHFEKFCTPSSLSGLRTSFETEVCSGFYCTSDTMRWIKDVEMATFADNAKTSQSIFGYNSQTPRCLMQRLLPLSLKRSSQIRTSRKRINPEEQKAQLDNRFLRGRKIALMIL